jgi:hypothetical protein
LQPNKRGRERAPLVAALCGPNRAKARKRNAEAKLINTIRPHTTR